MITQFKMPDLKPSSYLSAMSQIVEKFESKKKKVIFLVVTDDPIKGAFHILIPSMILKPTNYVIYRSRQYHESKVQSSLLIPGTSNSRIS